MNTIHYKETNKIELFYLKKIWFYYQSIAKSDPNSEEHKVDWKYINGTFNLLGIGTEPTMQFLLNETPDFEEFEEWIIENGCISPALIKQFNNVVSRKETGTDKLDTEVNILSEEDLECWNTKGYVVIKNAVSKEDCENTVNLICETINADLQNESTWYKKHPLKQGIMIQLFQDEILNKNRLSPKIKLAYEQLWKRKDLLVSMDRVSFNPPETDSYQFPGPNLHWDVSLKQPIPYGLQGILYLSDTEKTQGAFTVIPEFHTKIDSWLDNLPEEANPRDSELLKNETLDPIAGETGDFIIWNHCLPHGSCPNTSDKPRFVQYINYQPINLEYQEEWI